jgi:hypothetical protein
MMFFSISRPPTIMSPVQITPPDSPCAACYDQAPMAKSARPSKNNSREVLMCSLILGSRLGRLSTRS